jgi:hypothetical protein
MIKHALAVALLGLGIGCTAHVPADAAPLSGAAVSSMRTADAAVIKAGFRCLDEVPVVQGFVAFFQLLRDEEIAYHCLDREDGRYYDRRAYDDRSYPGYKDGGYKDGYTRPKDLKAPPLR